MKLLFENWRKYLNESIDITIGKIKGLACPEPTQDLALNTKNRDRSREQADYGPMNPLEPSMGYWKLAAGKWAGATPKEAMGQRCGNCVAFDVSPEC